MNKSEEIERKYLPLILVSQSWDDEKHNKCFPSPNRTVYYSIVRVKNPGFARAGKYCRAITGFSRE